MKCLKLFLDSSYLIYLRYAENDEVEGYVHALLERAVETGAELLVNMIVIDEAMWILCRKYGRSMQEVLEFIDRLIPLFGVVALDYADYDPLKEAVAKYRLKPSDGMHVASMKKAATVYMVSEDAEFDEVDWIKRVWLGTPYEKPV